MFYKPLVQADHIVSSSMWNEIIPVWWVSKLYKLIFSIIFVLFLIPSPHRDHIAATHPLPQVHLFWLEIFHYCAAILCGLTKYYMIHPTNSYFGFGPYLVSIDFPWHTAQMFQVTILSLNCVWLVPTATAEMYAS